MIFIIPNVVNIIKKSVQKCTKVYKSVQKCTVTFRNIYIYIEIEIFKIVQKVPKNDDKKLTS